MSLRFYKGKSKRESKKGENWWKKCKKTNICQSKNCVEFVEKYGNERGKKIDWTNDESVEKVGFGISNYFYSLFYYIFTIHFQIHLTRLVSFTDENNIFLTVCMLFICGVFFFFEFKKL